MSEQQQQHKIADQSIWLVFSIISIAEMLTEKARTIKIIAYFSWMNNVYS